MIFLPSYAESALRHSCAHLCCEQVDATAKPRHPLWRTHLDAGARHVDGQSRWQVSRREPELDRPALGVAAMDMLRPRIQESPARCVGPLLHGVVLPR